MAHDVLREETIGPVFPWGLKIPWKCHVFKISVMLSSEEELKNFPTICVAKGNQRRWLSMVIYVVSLCNDVALSSKLGHRSLNNCIQPGHWIFLQRLEKVRQRERNFNPSWWLPRITSWGDIGFQRNQASTFFAKLATAHFPVSNRGRFYHVCGKHLSTVGSCWE